MKKFIGKLHLWLGLATGIIVFVVSLTGAAYVFEEEITALAQPWRSMPAAKQLQLSPLAINNAGKGLKDAKLSYFISRNGQLTEAVFNRGKKSVTLFINPNNGEVIKTQADGVDKFDFFGFVLDGHRALWLPYDIGRPIVDYATLLFVLLLISGLVLWWPKNKSAAKQRYWFQWKNNTRWKRKNYDLHNIPGFYAMVVLLCISLSGIIIGLGWFSQAFYWATSGGVQIEEYQERFSDTTKALAHPEPVVAVQKIWEGLKDKHPAADGIYMSVPLANKETIYANVYMVKGKYYRDNSYEFDQHTLKPIIRKNDPYHEPYEKAGFAAKLRRMNYDIHVGEILGFPGKCLAFFAAIISASLPVSGTLIWWGRRKKQPKKAGKIKPASQ